jgi:uncharacterized membrane protein
MTVIGLSSYAGAIVLGALIGSTTIYLAFAAIVVATALVPGFVLMRREPAEAV